MQKNDVFNGNFGITPEGKEARNVPIIFFTGEVEDEIDAESEQHRRMTSEPVPENIPA
ncbi:MAG: hypothetical protein PHO56_02105 [Patescibacteria group bacterium]|nr:hypothetical protein [Patescibacteria group bacterium]